MSGSVVEGCVCSICCEEIAEQQYGYTLDECGHTFHTSCIVKWFRQSSTCPLCRDVGTIQKQIDGLTLRERAKEMKRIARRKNAPKELKKLCERGKFLKMEAVRQRKESREFDATHRWVLKEARRLRWKAMRTDWRCHDHDRVIGCFHSTSYPLPPVMVNRHNSFNSFYL